MREPRRKEQEGVENVAVAERAWEVERWRIENGAFSVCVVVV